LEQVQRVGDSHEAAELRCIAINDAYLLAPWADVQYAADSSWHSWHSAGIAKPSLGFSEEDVRLRWAGFSGEKCSIEASGGNIKDERVHMLRNLTYPYHQGVFSTDPRSLVTGRCSGFQAFNLAVLAGAKTVLLLGFDAWSNGAKFNWHDGHPRLTDPAIFTHMRQAFSLAEPIIKGLGVRVINCSPKSMLGFEKMDIEAALSALEVA
jgi:hypothetical protein